MSEGSSRTEGALLLARVPTPQEEIANRLGVSQALVSLWRAGKRKPGTRYRDMLAEAFGIPFEAWDEALKPPPPPTLYPSPPETVTTSPPPPTNDRVELLERMCEDLMRKAQGDAAGTEGLTNLERARVMSSLAATLTTLRKLKGEALSEVHVLRHPKWISLRDAILGALRDHPEALDAVVTTLQSLESGRL